MRYAQAAALRFREGGLNERLSGRYECFREAFDPIASRLLSAGFHKLNLRFIEYSGDYRVWLLSGVRP
jgi:hypothetical protein